MPKRSYQLVLVGCVLSWFMMGLHIPVVHQMTHGESTSVTVLAITSLFAISAFAGLWVLLRARVS